MWEKNKKIIECNNIIVICDVGTAQWEDDTIKCEKKKIKESLNVIKSTVTCGVGIVQCVDGAIKCEKK